MDCFQLLPPAAGWEFLLDYLKSLNCILPPLSSAVGGQVQRGLGRKFELMAKQPIFSFVLFYFSSC